jgi:hypothetical protein
METSLLSKQDYQVEFDIFFVEFTIHAKRSSMMEDGGKNQVNLMEGCFNGSSSSSDDHDDDDDDGGKEEGPVIRIDRVSRIVDEDKME